VIGLVEEIAALLRERDAARREVEYLKEKLKRIQEVFGEFFPDCAHPVIHWSRTPISMSLDIGIAARTPVVRFRMSEAALWAARHPYDLVAHALQETMRSYLEAWVKEVVETCPPPELTK
jgi:hypothetical protein